MDRACRGVLPNDAHTAQGEQCCINDARHCAWTQMKRWKNETMKKMEKWKNMVKMEKWKNGEMKKNGKMEKRKNMENFEKNMEKHGKHIEIMEKEKWVRHMP